MFEEFRQVVEEIIKRYGKMSLDDFYSSSYELIEVKKEGYFDFTIEKYENLLYVGHHRMKNGMNISDPIFVFRIRYNTWYPIRLEENLEETIIGRFDEEDEHLCYPQRFEKAKSYATICAKEWKSYYLA